MATKLKVNYEFVGDSTTPVTRTDSIKHGDSMLSTVINAAAATVNTKADKNYVDTELTKKANASDVTSRLATKADSTTVSAIASRVSTNETNIATQTARIDEIASLPEGSTSGDAELMDIRVGADSVTYTSAGAAVRGQISDVKSDLGELEISVDWIEGKYLDSDGYAYDYAPFNVTDFIPLRHGDFVSDIKFTVYGNSATYCGFYNERYELILAKPIGSAVTSSKLEFSTSEIENCHYIRLTNDKWYAPKISYTNAFKSKIYEDFVKKEKINFYNSTVHSIDGFYNGGEWYSEQDYHVSNPVYLEAGTYVTSNDISTYGENNFRQVYAVNPNDDISIVKNIIYGEKLNIKSFDNHDVYKFTIPESGYFRFNLPMYELYKTVMIVKGTDYPSYYINPNMHIESNVGFSKLMLSEIYSIINESKIDYKSPLYGKKIAYNGDSICENRPTGYAKNGGAYAKIIADKTGCTYENRAVGGGTLAVKSGRHNIVLDIVNMSDDADLICIEGGINDYWTSVPLGTFSPSDFTGELDTTTVCGALESILRQAINKWVGKPICFVITHKITTTAFNKNSENYTFSEQHDVMVKILEKYSIPYYDAFIHGGLNAYMSSLDNAYLNGGGNTHPDGCHPDEGGYRRYYAPQLIKLFESIMPILD